MIEVYNEVLRLASQNSTKWWDFTCDQPPSSMPKYTDLMAAIDNADRQSSSPAEPATDQVIKSSLARIIAINRMIREHSLGPGITSGEIICPECKAGILCYLVCGGQNVAVECSTLGCLSWDIQTHKTT
jgi:hypothetical protein